MNIKPFVSPDTSMWDAYSPFFWIAATVSLLVIIVGHVIGFKKDNGEICAFSLVIGCVLFLTCNFVAGIMSYSISDKAYQSYKAEVHESLEKEGFKITSGSLDLHPNTESSITLDSNGKEIDCTVFASKDVDKDLTFSCGEDQLSLADVKDSFKSKV